MISLQTSRHGQARLQQRAFRGNDHELIYLLGVHINDQEIFMPKRVVEYEIHIRRKKITAINRRTNAATYPSIHDDISELKREIHQLERIRNKKIVVDGTTLITAYHVQ